MNKALIVTGIKINVILDNYLTSISIGLISSGSLTPNLTVSTPSSILASLTITS